MIKVQIIENDTLKVNVGETAIIETGGKTVQIGDGLKLEDNVLSVDTADVVEQDNTKPVTSAAVFVGLEDAFVPLSNIEIDAILNKFK